MDKVRLHVGSDRKYYPLFGLCFCVFGGGGELAADTSGVGTESLGGRGGESGLCCDDREDHKRKSFLRTRSCQVS